MKSPHSSLKCCKNLANVVQKAWAPPAPTIWHGWGISNKFHQVKIHIFKVTLKMTKDQEEKKTYVGDIRTLSVGYGWCDQFRFTFYSFLSQPRWWGWKKSEASQRSLTTTQACSRPALCKYVGRRRKFYRNALFVCKHSETPEFWLFTITLLQFNKVDISWHALPKMIRGFTDL